MNNNLIIHLFQKLKKRLSNLNRLTEILNFFNQNLILCRLYLKIRTYILFEIIESPNVKREKVKNSMSSIYFINVFFGDSQEDNNNR